MIIRSGGCQAFKNKGYGPLKLLQGVRWGVILSGGEVGARDRARAGGFDEVDGNTSAVCCVGRILATASWSRRSYGPSEGFALLRMTSLAAQDTSRNDL